MFSHPLLLRHTLGAGHNRGAECEFAELNKIGQSTGMCMNCPDSMQILLCSKAAFLNLGAKDTWDWIILC